MTIVSQRYILAYGTYGFSDSALAYTTILSVNREGTGYEVGTDAASNRKVKFTRATGEVLFNNPGALGGGISPIDRPEYVDIIYKY